jgi:hypothetical protein
MFRYDLCHLTREEPRRGGDSSPVKDSVVASTQFSAANTVRVVLEAVDQSDLDTTEVPAALDVHYRRLAGRELNLPCCNLFRVSDGVVRDCRIYLDVNPVIVAGGGPVGVGDAVGRSMRFLLVSVQVVVLVAALALYSANPNCALTV